MDNYEKQVEQIEENLHKWFKEKWVRFGPDGKIRGKCAREKSSEGKPKCRPLKSAQAMGKDARATAARRKRREDPNPDRKGKAKNVKTESHQIDELKCWKGYSRVRGVPAGAPGSCKKKTEESTMENTNENHMCPICGGELVSELLMNEKKDACYYKVKSRYKVWPSAYASGALVKCRKKGAKNWGTKSEGVEELDEKWSEKYKRSIDCSHPKGFSQKAHCQGRKKHEGTDMNIQEQKLRKMIAEITKELLLKEGLSPKGVETVKTWVQTHGAREAGVKIIDSCIRKQIGLTSGDLADTPIFMNGLDAIEEALEDGDYDGAYALAKETAQEMLEDEGMTGMDECWECYQGAMQEGTNEVWEECYRKTNWDMVPEGEEHTCEGDQFYEIYGDFNADAKQNLAEAEYRGRKVKLGKPMRGDVKKFKVFVRNPKTGKVKKVNFGDKNMRIKKSNPKRRKSFRARHKCGTAKDRTSARYWSCRKW